MKISIIIPVYNVERYLRECLDSVRVQTFTDWECICVDDGSTDNSLAILEEYKAKDSRFRIISRKHSNAGACRNAGLDVAKGEYLSFLDSDDVFAPNMLELLSKALDNTGADIATCKYKDFYEDAELDTIFKRKDDVQIERIKSPASTDDIFKRWVSWAWDKLFRRDLINSNGIRFQCIDSWNDMFFVDSALSFAKEVAVLDSCCIGHRKHGTSIMATSTRKRCFAQALTEYYNNTLVANGLITNKNLLDSFYRAIFRNALFMLNNAHDGDDFVVLYQALQDLMDSINLRNLHKEIFDNELSLYSFYEKTCRLKMPHLFLFEETKILRDENKELRQVPDLRRSVSYRIGRMITLIPRVVRKILPIG